MIRTKLNTFFELTKLIKTSSSANLFAIISTIHRASLLVLTTISFSICGLLSSSFRLAEHIMASSTVRWGNKWSSCIMQHEYLRNDLKSRSLFFTKMFPSIPEVLKKIEGKVKKVHFSIRKRSRSESFISQSERGQGQKGSYINQKEVQVRKVHFSIRKRSRSKRFMYQSERGQGQKGSFINQKEVQVRKVHVSIRKRSRSERFIYQSERGLGQKGSFINQRELITIFYERYCCLDNELMGDDFEISDVLYPYVQQKHAIISIALQFEDL